ncbi:uncharacterized protein LOC120635648 isoform X2 [Pararge aegeria]|uniref:uncharacterized protein LOC120635648 isoform X2 n=1 Tax=Pararge aegeria TaxID=116150 RepID=UPI0019CFE2FF|nr:uncharacterized protein LOC120635648 isoform X2 [Pararge aegeria]
MEAAANTNLEKKIVKTSAQRQKEYRMRKKIQKQLSNPKKIPKTNAQCQQQYRENQKIKELSETLILARRQKNAERSKRYRDRLKVRKLHAEHESLQEDTLTTTSIENDTETVYFNTNCEQVITSQPQLQVNQNQPITNCEARQVIHEKHAICARPNTLLQHETNSTDAEMPKVPYQNIEGPPEQTHTEYLIIPKMEILEDLEITFDKECEDSDFIFPKEESDSRERDLLKPIKTELILSKDIVQVRQQQVLTEHTEIIQNRHLSIQHNDTKIKLEPDDASFSGDHVTPDIAMPKRIAKRPPRCRRAKNIPRVKNAAKTGAERIRAYRERIKAQSSGYNEGVASQQHSEENRHDGLENRSSLLYKALKGQISVDGKTADNNRQFVIQVESVAGNLYLALSAT